MLGHRKGRKINVFSPRLISAISSLDRLILREFLFVLLPRSWSEGQEVEALIKLAEEPRSAVVGKTAAGRCGHMAAAELAMLRRQGVPLRVSVMGLFPLNQFIQFIREKNLSSTLLKKKKKKKNACFLLCSLELNPGQAWAGRGWGFKNVREPWFDVNVCVCRVGRRGVVQAAVRGVPGQPPQRHQPGRARPVSSGGAAGAER